MLLQRILTALVLATIAISAIFLLPSLYFYLFIAIIILIAAWEWTGFAELDRTSEKIGFMFLFIVPMLGVVFWTQLLELF